MSSTQREIQPPVQGTRMQAIRESALSLGRSFELEEEKMSAAAKQQKLEQPLTSGRESIPAIYSAIVGRISYLTETELAILRAARQNRDKPIVSDVIWFDHTPEVLAILERIEAVSGERK